jgi:predicted MPP superfamily phosphohydrolase
MSPLAWLGIAAAAILLYAMTIARWRFKVIRSEIAVLPKGSKPIRVLHISDIHLAPWQKRKQRFVAGLIAEKPDLVIDTGDNLGHKDVIYLALKTLQPLLDVPGAFVNGSNDYFAPSMRNPFSYILKPSNPTKDAPLETNLFTNSLEQRGWKNLNNKSAVVRVNDLRIGLVGVDDPHDSLDDLTSVKKNLATLPAIDFVIGVAHAPYIRVIEEFTNQGVELMFAGHTHGGQVRFPFVGALTTNSDLPNKYAKGLSGWQFGKRSMMLNVSSGMGNSIYAPVRWFNRPEARMLTLIAKRD